VNPFVFGLLVGTGFLAAFRLRRRLQPQGPIYRRVVQRGIMGDEPAREIVRLECGHVLALALQQKQDSLPCPECAQDIQP
jgi:hypothetical protein